MILDQTAFWAKLKLLAEIRIAATTNRCLISSRTSVIWPGCQAEPFQALVSKMKAMNVERSNAQQDNKS
jgi:hypothetical protein